MAREHGVDPPVDKATRAGEFALFLHSLSKYSILVGHYIY